MHLRISQICYSLLSILFIQSCSSEKKESVDSLGEIQFTVSGKEEAQPAFKKGMLLLHSFEYEDAADEFRTAITLDKDFAMAYWGEAMTHNHPLWRYQNLEKATTILNQLAPTPEEREVKAKTELEKDLFKGIHILYGPGNKVSRDSSFAEYMGSLYNKYPDNNEVAAMYSLSLIGSVPVGRNTEVYEHAAEIAKKVLNKNPQHPGALHYLIHAFDDPEHAAMAKSTADKYSVVAPAAGHALHMPTHIYLSLGLWDKVISSNIDSWQAGQERKERKKLSNNALNYHAYHWLMYGYLQKDDKKAARKIVDSMLIFNNEMNSDRAREHMIYQKSTYLAETNEYGNDINNIIVEVNDLNITTRAMDHFANGMNLYHKKDIPGMDKVIFDLTNAILLDEERISNTGNKLCGSIKAELPNSLDIEQATIMLLELKAMNAWLKNDKTATENFLKKAVDMETKVSFSYGPPPIVKPSFELYGEWLLENNRPQEALAQFEQSLKAAPNKLLSVKGKEIAQQQVKMNSSSSL